MLKYLEVCTITADYVFLYCSYTLLVYHHNSTTDYINKYVQLSLYQNVKILYCWFTAWVRWNPNNYLWKWRMDEDTELWSFQVLTTNLLTLGLGLSRAGRVASWALFSNMARRFRAVSIEGIHSSSSSKPPPLRLLSSLLRSTSVSHFSNLARNEAAFLALCEDATCIASKEAAEHHPQPLQQSIYVSKILWKILSNFYHIFFIKVQYF